MKLIEALEGLRMKEGDDFPEGEKLLRKEDHQAFIREFIFDIKDGKHQILETIPKEKTLFPPACTFAYNNVGQCVLGAYEKFVARGRHFVCAAVASAHVTHRAWTTEF